MKVYLYISYNVEDGGVGLDHQIAALIFGMHKAKVIGSGFGFGVRDLEFRLEAPLDQQGVNDTFLRLKEYFERLITVKQDAWPDDDLDEDAGPIEEYEIENLEDAA